MNRRPTLSAFTPSNTDPELLERIFVQREKLLTAITNRLARSMTSGEKHHALLIGPRGSGKTNLVTLVVHRLHQREELSDAMRIAWLGEDDVMVELIDVALAIADRLGDEFPDEFSVDPRSAIRGLSGDDAAIAVLNLVCDQLKHRNLIVVMENLDRVFAGLGDLGQKRWRAFLQETTRMATLATSQQIFEGVSSRNEAFFGFFDVHHLEPLSVEDARALIRKVGIEQGKLDLVTFLDSSTGRYRVRALHHLAGGNHRMYVLLSEYLTKDSLDDLVDSFEQLAEELTPYFQERLRSVPPQQAKLVQCLANSEGARTVKEIAEKTFITERNCSKQLGNLRQAGYVVSSKRGKESYYELAEPLMRLCLEVKNQRGRPLKLVAKFLKVWFPASRLGSSIDRDSESSTRGDQYRLEASRVSNGFEGAIKEGLSSEIKELIERSDFLNAKKLTEEMECVDVSEAMWLGAIVASREGNDEQEIELLTELILLPSTPISQKVKALLKRGIAYGQRGEPELEIADYSAVIEMPDAPADQRAEAFTNIGVMQWHAGRFQQSQESFDASLKVDGTSLSIRTESLFALPEPMVALHAMPQVIAALRQAFEQGDPECDSYGGTPGDLLGMVMRRGPMEWETYVKAIVPLFVEHGVAAKLGKGIVESIGKLDEGDYSDSQLNQWNRAWQSAGKECAELDLPLRCLDAATEVLRMEKASDRPLFRLPLEIRGIVRDMLSKTLGPTH